MTLAPTITHTGKSITPNAPLVFYTAATGFIPVTYTVAAADNSTALWTVTVKWNLTSADITDYLDDAYGDPIILPVEIDLASSGWTDLLSAIQTANKNVALDLSACTMSGTEFAPYIASATGESKIVSLVLPDTAESIAVGTSSNVTFKNFSALTSVTGSKVETIGNYAFGSLFGSLTTRKTLDLPLAADIGNYAFYGCTSLTEVTLPAATDIGQEAFRGCTSLETVSLPGAVDIGMGAFRACSGLKTVESNAAAIGYLAFADCTSLETVSLPEAISISNNAFQGCSKLETASLSKATSIGNSAFQDCSKLKTIDLRAATSFDAYVFRYTGTQALTVILGPAAPPTLGATLFSGVNSAKLVTVQVPSGATGYDDTWKSSFTGGNANISLTIKYGP
jgi:hypothetical protein